jgi:hypothetical protein
MTENGNRKRTRIPFEEKYNETRIERYKRLRRTDAHESLQEIMGKQARFRDIQEPAIKAIMAGESPVITVMGTGGEKNLLFMLPAYYSQSGMTVTSTVTRMMRLAGTAGLGSWSGTGFMETSRYGSRSRSKRRPRLRPTSTPRLRLRLRLRLTTTPTSCQHSRSDPRPYT